MDKIGAYHVFQNSMYEKASSKQDVRAEKPADRKTEAVGKKAPAGVKQPELSDRAKELLEELKKTYANMDFMVAEYETEEEAAGYLSRGTKEFSVLIEPETLEQMAADEEVKDKYLKALEKSGTALKHMVEELDDEDKKQVRKLGITIGADGTVSYFAELEEAGAKQKERIEKAKEANAREAKKEEKAERAEKQEELLKVQREKRKRALIKAGSAEELLEKLKNVDWSTIEPEEVKQTGGRIDFTA